MEFFRFLFFFKTFVDIDFYTSFIKTKDLDVRVKEERFFLILNHQL